MSGSKDYNWNRDTPIYSENDVKDMQRYCVTAGAMLGMILLIAFEVVLYYVF